MQVNSVNSIQNPKISFRARNPEIRDADKFIRFINNKLFPGLSTSSLNRRIKTVKNVTQSQQDSIDQMCITLGGLRNMRPNEKKQPLEYIETLIPEVKKSKLRNCGELGSLTKIVLAINDIESQKASLYVYTKKIFGLFKLKFRLNHTFALVNLPKNADLSNPGTYQKTCILDTWSGFADYAPNAFKRFEAEYQNAPIMKIMRLMKVPVNLGVKLNVDFKINEETLKVIQNKHPELKLRQAGFFKYMPPQQEYYTNEQIAFEPSLANAFST